MLSRMNVSVDPCHDFYRYACESFITDDTIPPNEPFYSTLSSTVKHTRVARMRKVSVDFTYTRAGHRRSREGGVQGCLCTPES